MAGSVTAIGIDLGTTNSCVGVFRNGKVEIIANDLGNRTMPSMVSFVNKERFIGERAKSLMITNLNNTIYGVKRIIGRKYKDKSLQKDMETWPFRVVSDWSKPKIAVAYKKKEKKFTPQEISAMILSKLKETAETFLEHGVTEAVITVPAYFNDSQRKATIDAANIAGLKVLQVLNEPTAAAVAYGIDKKIADERNILIYDFGGGTFDVSIMTIKDGNFRVRAVAGDNHLGGGDIDNRLVEYLKNDFKRKHHKDISVNTKAMSKLRLCCEDAKIGLSSNATARIDLDNLMDGINYSTTISRSRFEQLNADLFMNTMKLVQQALYDANMAPTDIQNVVLVGGTTRIPKVQSLLQELFGDKKLRKSINQDEAVAYGAAVQAAVLKGYGKLKINDVTPFSLGIEIGAGNTCVIIKRNTAIPTKHMKTFPTNAGQDQVDIKICEGEQQRFKDNNFLGHFVLKGYTASKTGIDVEVKFEIDDSGILTVSATAGGLESKITIDQDRLSKDDIKHMAQKEHKYKADDVKQRKCAESKSNLEDYIDDIRSKIEYDFKNKIEKADKHRMLSFCQDMSLWLEDDDQPREVEHYLAKQIQLERIWTPILTKIKTY